MINNFKQISELLSFNNEDEFYFLQILQRKKDNTATKGTNNNSRLVKAYHIKSVKYLLDLEEEIVGLCEFFNARAGINLNKRSFKKCALQTARLILDQMANQDDSHAVNAFNSVCGRYMFDKDKKWILDIDDINVNALQIKEAIRKCNPVGNKYITTIPSKNGYHLIMNPFAINEFNTFMHQDYNINWTDIIDIHKNNPTNLYIP